MHRILIVRTDRIGDVILTLPMAHVLKQHLPNLHIAMLIQRYTTELVEDDQTVDQVIFFDRPEGPEPFFRLVATLKAGRFDAVFHTHPRFRLALSTWLARIPVRIGTGYRWYSWLFNRRVYEHRKLAEHHELEYNLHLLEAVGCPPPPQKIKLSFRIRPEAAVNVRHLLRGAGVLPGERIVIIHPGSGGSARDWSAKNFGLLAERLSGLEGVKILVTGGPGEEQLVRETCRIAGSGVISFVHPLSLREYGALASMAVLFVANSTGPLHIAAAVGTPVIGLYPQVTALSARRWSPYTDKKIILSPVGKQENCAACLRRKERSCECMDSITVEEVYEAAARQLKESISETVL